MTLDLFRRRPRNEFDNSRHVGRCGCGRSGRLYLLRGRLVCGGCQMDAEIRIARRVEAGTIKSKPLKGRRK